MRTDSRRVRIIENLSKRRRRDKPFPLYNAYRDQYVTLEYFLEHLND
jgi:hypothetical protein